jgi:hypothetical protein
MPSAGRVVEPANVLSTAIPDEMVKGNGQGHLSRRA